MLKDSASIKVYGKRGANGVILVNTQRGSKTKIQNKEISFSQKTTSTDAVPDFPVSGTVVDEQGVRRLESALLCLIQIMVR